MSLIVALTNPYKLWVAADTRAISTSDGPLPDPATKIKVIQHGGQTAIVAIGGEVEFNGRHVFSYLDDDHSRLFSTFGLTMLCSELLDAWKRDVAATNWASTQEKTNYESNSFLTLLVAHSPNKLSLIHGTVSTLSPMVYDPARHITAFGVTKSIQHLLEQPEKHDSQWRSYLADIFETAAMAELAVAFPVDMIMWDSGTRISAMRFLTPECLRDG